jgi:hypothetical protein
MDVKRTPIRFLHSYVKLPKKETSYIFDGLFDFDFVQICQLPRQNPM